MSAVGATFFLYARHASDREHIALIDGCLLVELIQKEQVRQFRLDPRWTRVESPVPVYRDELIGLEVSGMRVEVGGF